VKLENYLWYFLANLSKTLCINFYQNRSTFAVGVFLCPTVYNQTNLTMKEKEIITNDRYYIRLFPLVSGYNIGRSSPHETLIDNRQQHPYHSFEIISLKNLLTVKSLTRWLLRADCFAVGPTSAADNTTRPTLQTTYDNRRSRCHIISDLSSCCIMLFVFFVTSLYISATQPTQFVV